MTVVDTKTLRWAVLCNDCVMAVSNLSENNFEYWLHRNYSLRNNRTDRVTVYTLGGIQIGLPGLGEGDNKLTFPMHYEIKDALDGQLWVRFATDAEKQIHGQWWHISEVQPTALLHHNGRRAGNDEMMGCVSTTMAALQTHELETHSVEERPLIDVDSVSTPPTPSWD